MKKFTVLIFVLLASTIALSACNSESDSEKDRNYDINAKQGSDGDDSADEENPCDLEAFAKECDTGCPYGYAGNENGCPICACEEGTFPDGCEKPTCPKRCDTYRWENGCLGCECGGPDGDSGN